jgi:hypothetical protein
MPDTWTDTWSWLASGWPWLLAILLVYADKFVALLRPAEAPAQTAAATRVVFSRPLKRQQSSMLLQQQQAPGLKDAGLQAPVAEQAAKSQMPDAPQPLLMPNGSTTGEGSVVQLLAKHADKVSALRREVKAHPHFHADRHDGLWLLRYLLSHQCKVKPAAVAAKKALQMRADRGLDAIAKVVRTQYCQEWPHFAKLEVAGGVFYLPRRPSDESAAEGAAWAALDAAVLRGEPVDACHAAAHAAHAAAGGEGEWLWYARGHIEACRMTDMDMHGLWRLRREMDEYMIYDHEWNFVLLDEATRRTGRLVKVVRAYSSRGFRLKDLSLKLLQHDGEQQTLAQDLYPQLLGQQLFCDLPKIIHWMWVHVIAPLTPERTRSKTCIVDTANRADGALLDRHLKPEERPVWLGGRSPKEWPPTWAWCDAAMPPIGETPFLRYDEPGFVYRPYASS